jgi:hypothetical protein
MTRKTLALRIATAAVAVATMVLVPVAFAAKGHGGGSASTTTLTLASATVAAGDPFHISGCGYTVGQPVNVTVDSPSAQYFFSTGVDANGCVSFGYYTSEAGQYMVKTYQGGTKQTLMASASLTAS